MRFQNYDPSPQLARLQLIHDRHQVLGVIAAAGAVRAVLQWLLRL